MLCLSATAWSSDMELQLLEVTVTLQGHLSSTSSVMTLLMLADTRSFRLWARIDGSPVLLLEIADVLCLPLAVGGTLEPQLTHEKVSGDLEPPHLA